MRRRWLIVAGVLLALAVLGAATFVIWARQAAEPTEQALAALQSDAQVEVTTDTWLVFSPVEAEPSIGFIFYPGGRVDPRAYAPFARDLAAAGYLVVIVPMPLNLAVLAPNRASEVIAVYPSITHWVVGGHSLGGAMAARFARAQPNAVDGLVLWAAYPAEGNDLSGHDLLVLSIYASEDGLATQAEIDAARPLLPPTTQYVMLDGGNHAQFGGYGLQPGDGIARIDPAEQQRLTVEATAAFLAQIGDRAYYPGFGSLRMRTLWTTSTRFPCPASGTRGRCMPTPPARMGGSRPKRASPFTATTAMTSWRSPTMT